MDVLQATAFKVMLAGFALFVVSTITKYRRGLKAVSYLPGLRVPFHPFAPPGVFLPTSWWNPGGSFNWAWRHTFYKKYRNETVSLVPFLVGEPTLYSSSLDVARQISGGGTKNNFIKPPATHAAILRWGMSLVSSNGETWRKHRRIMGPAFNNRVYQMVWTETLRTYHEMIAAEGWADKKEINVPIVQSLTFKLALLIIGKCGFGFSFNWLEPAQSADGKMTIQRALRMVADSALAILFVPKWIQRLPFSGMTETLKADEHLMEFMKTQVKERKAEIGSMALGNASTTETDAFTMLIEANEDNDGKFKLDDEELIGNVFIMLFAGHETTAHSLAATLGLISLRNDLQEEIFEHIIGVIGYDRAPVFDDYPKLDKVLAAFYEALRMFPSGNVLLREAAEDTVLEIPNPHGQEGTTTIPVPKGVQVIVDLVGVQYNPRYFDEPEKYKPSRWYGITNDEAFSAFGLGPRACIGRKFATVESVCFLTLLLRDYKVEPLLRPGETKEQWQDRVIEAKVGLTLGVVNVPVRFIKRTRK
ncbi:cytochrome P450 [Phlegmacium glaucopus]|nr:cytochrome P450 [Phlegmacium glaucopus]